MTISLRDYYLLKRDEWAGKHTYFMGCDRRAPVSQSEGMLDFVTGTPDFNKPLEKRIHHLSSRGLKWNQELDLFFYYTIIAKWYLEGDLPEGVEVRDSDLVWWESKFRTAILGEGLLGKRIIYGLDEFADKVEVA